MSATADATHFVNTKGRIEMTDCVFEGRGRKPTYDSRKVGQIICATQNEKPAAATHWSCRAMAKRQGVSKATIARIWNTHGFKPHRQKSFKLSKDKRFVEKLTDVVGLYLNPPDKALV